MTVGERIKKVREKTGMSQVEFADKINVSNQTLYKYEDDIITNIPSDKFVTDFVTDFENPHKIRTYKLILRGLDSRYLLLRIYSGKARKTA